MASKVLGSGPVGFTDSSGNQRFIPLSVLEFSDGGIDASKWPLYTVNESIIDPLIDDLIDNKFLRPAPSPPPTPAMVLKAAVSGATGNSIQVTFSQPKVDTNTPDKTNFDATITAKYTYLGISYDSSDSTSPVFIKNILGTETLPGTSPCWIRVKDAETPSRPKVGSYPLTGGSTTIKSSAEIDGDPTGKAFTTEVWKAGAEGDSITVTIPKVDATAKTFTLVVEIKQRPIKSIKLSDLPAKLAGSGIVLAVTKPEGGKFDIPAKGTVGLSGGSDAQAATSASATAVATT